MSDIISRKEAKELGVKFYFTGKPCKHGHTCERYVRTGDCKECMSLKNKSVWQREYQKNRYKETPEYYQNYYKSNRDKILKYQEEYRKNNRDKILDRNRSYYKKNSQAIKDRVISWQKENPDKANLKNSNRRAAQHNRSIPLSKKHQDEIAHIYEQASLLRELGYDVHVDHIVPLQGCIVSGLHVPWNLQIIPSEENLKKNNRFETIVEVY